MSTPDAPQRPDASVEAYRAASDALDERPSESTRAAIVAAAASQAQPPPRAAAPPASLELAPRAEEHIELAPLAADAAAPKAHAAASASAGNVRALPVSSAERRPARLQAEVRTLPVRRWPRWPLAAAASVLIASLAVLVAVRTDRETAPTLQPPPRTVAEATPSAPSPAVASAPAGSAAPPAATAPTAMNDARPAAAERHSEKPQATPDVVASAPPAQMRARDAAGASPATDPARAEPEGQTKQSAAAGSARAEVNVAEAAGSAEAAAPRPAAPAAERAAAAPRAARSDLPDDWIARIIELRRDGRDAEAEAELRRFRERYPHIPVPSAALARPSR